MSNKCPVFGKLSGNAVIDSRIAILEKRIKEIESKIQEGFTEKINIEIIGRFLKQFRTSFDELDNRERRLLIQSIVKEITIYADDKIKLSFSLPVPAMQKMCIIFAPAGSTSYFSFVIRNDFYYFYTE